jgi:tubulin-folding cofactor B
MPADTYSSLTSNTVLSYKRTHKLGRFDPSAPFQLEAQAALTDREIADRNIAVGARCRMLTSDGTPEDERRGEVAFVGEVAELPGVGKWVGVRLDEPTGKNEGGVKGTVYFDAEGRNRGVFVRPERVEVGDFPIVDEFAEDMEEI